MGGIMARAGRDNDELIDVLIEENYIKTSKVEKVFRAVDRAEYFLPHQRSSAYNGLAWKSYNLHLSAPCVYSTVMEGLCLEPGLSFLNLGSGTGYLSTMVGLILGSEGVNHGIEYYGDVVDYANAKLENFKKYSGAVDEFDYCEPKFKQGNVLCLSSDFHAQYDRVYCGAAVPEQFESYMKNLLKVGGILVMPVDDKLLQVKRISQTQWETDSLLPVSFAVLIQPEWCKEGNQDMVQMFDIEPTSLQALCRNEIRSIIRRIVEQENPKVKKSQKLPIKKKIRAVRRLVVPLFDSDEESSDDDLERHRRPRTLNDLTEQDNLYNLVLAPFRGGSARVRSREEPPNGEDNKMEIDEAESSERDKSTMDVQQVETQAVIEHVPNQENNDTNRRNGNDNNPSDESCSQVIADVLFNILRHTEEDTTNDEEEEEEPRPNQIQDQENKSKHQDQEDLIESQSSGNTTENDDSSSGSEDYENPNGPDGPKKATKKSSKWRRLNSSELKKDSSSDNDEEDEMRMYESPYTRFMASKIQELPLPPILKKYLNFYRAF